MSSSNRRVQATLALIALLGLAGVIGLNAQAENSQPRYEHRPAAQRWQGARREAGARQSPRGSTWSAGEQRLQLSPEGCSAHYPKELGVPLDFNGVNPQANVLKNGHIEAPTREVIRVKLQRVS